MKNNIGNNIKLFRTKLELSQQDVAYYCGISREILSYYETGEREVSLLHLEKISEYMDVDLEVFLEDDPTDIAPELSLAFRADELTHTDRANVAYFKNIVKNYLKMKKIALSNGIQA